MRQLEPRMIGNRRLSKDDSAALLTVNHAIEGNIPAVRKAARNLRRSGKCVEEALGAVKDPRYAGCGPIHMAAWAGRLEMCKFLIKDLRIDVNTAGYHGSTPLSHAIFGCGSTSVIRLLLDRGANPNIADTEGFTALHFTTRTGKHTDAGKRMWAANTRDTCEIAELLLSRGAYVDPICKRGTPLHMAAKSGNVRMVELLLRHQANIAKGKLYFRESAGLSKSAYKLHLPPLESFLCADYTAKSRPNRPDILVGLTELKCAELLIKAGADVNAGRPVTPLVIAASQGFTDCIKCLLEAGADANIPGKCGRTPAEIAVARGWIDCAEILSPLTSPAGIHDPVFGENDGWALKEQDDAALEENNGFFLKMQGDDAAFESMVLKMQGGAAFEENAYADALALYTKAMEADPGDSTLYAKRSLCWLHLSEEGKALDDANTYKAMYMDLSNSCYVQTAALILTKEYAQACQALMSGLKLDLKSDDLD